MTSIIECTELESVFVELFLYRLSVVILTLGRRDTGKTDFNLWIAETLNKFSLIPLFATNIKIYEPPFAIEHIDNLEDLREWATLHKSPRKLFICDEWGKVARRRTPMNQFNIDILDDLQTLRKFKLSLFIIAPAERYIDSASLGSDVLDAVITKPYFNNRKFALYDDQLERRHINLNEIPATSIKFDTWDTATFTRYSKVRKTRFKDKDLEVLSQWSEGSSAEDLGLHRMQINRLLKKFVKERLKDVSNPSHPQA